MANESDSTVSNGVVANPEISTGNNAVENTREGAENGQPQEQAPVSRGSFLKNLAMNMVIMYFITKLWRPSADTSSNNNLNGNPVRLEAANIYSNGTVFDLYVYYSENKYFSEFNNTEFLLWKKEGLIYGDWYNGETGDGTYVNHNKIVLTERMQNNGTIFLHVFVTLNGKSPDPSSRSKYLATHTIHKYKQLNKYRKVMIDNKYNLLTGKKPSEVIVKSTEEPMIISYWHPNITISMIYDYSNFVYGNLPPPLDEAVMFTPDKSRYKPIVDLNDYWNLLKDYQPINSSVSELNITLMYHPSSLIKWQVYTALTMRNKFAPSYFSDSNDDEQDALKEILLQISPLLLAVSIIVSLLHSIFEFLAFKNDIQFWRNRQSLEGLSVRSIFFNVFQSLIVFLYVMDNETNKMICISVFIGLLIEIWKINQVIDIKINREDKFLGLIPKLSVTDKSSYVHSNTKEYDELGFKYLSWILYPLVAIYSVYSIIYLEHKGWYSWLLSMMYGFLLTFGFIMMTPQLFINYKLKSVAHLPWRMMTYKALNTFIDDIFAFVIKMPTLYRLSCLRDDIIFFIFLYQRYIYRVDPSRVNEFGFSQEMENESSDVSVNQPVKSIEEKKDD